MQFSKVSGIGGASLAGGNGLLEDIIISIETSLKTVTNLPLESEDGLTS